MKEEVLFKTKKLWPGHDMDVLLITYDSGKMDLHCQTGASHNYIIGRAKGMLKKRGLMVSKVGFIEASGVYYTVKCQQKQQ